MWEEGGEEAVVVFVIFKWSKDLALVTIQSDNFPDEVILTLKCQHCSL